MPPETDMVPRIPSRQLAFCEHAADRPENNHQVRVCHGAIINVYNAIKAPRRVKSDPTAMACRPRNHLVIRQPPFRTKRPFHPVAVAVGNPGTTNGVNNHVGRRTHRRNMKRHPVGRLNFQREFL